MFAKYPYTDFHRLNADWILEKTRECLATVEGMETDVDDLKTRMTNAEGAINSLSASMDVAEGDIDTLQTGLGIAEQNIATNTDWLQNHEGRIDTLEGDVATLETDVGNLQTGLGDAEHDIDVLQGQMNGALQAIDTTEDAVEALDGRLDTAETDIGNLQATTDDLELLTDAHTEEINDITPLVATFTMTESSGSYSVTCDKTYTEMRNAINANRPVISKLIYGQVTIYLNIYSTTAVYINLNNNQFVSSATPLEDGYAIINVSYSANGLTADYYEL